MILAPRSRARRARRLHRGHRRFQLHHQRIECVHSIQRRLDILCRQAPIGSCRNHNAVLSRLIQRDHGDTGGGRTVNQDMTDIDALSLETASQRLTKGIIAHPTHHADPSTLPRRSHSLIRAFATGNGLKIIAQHGFAGPGHVLCPHNQIHVQTTDNDDVGHEGFPWGGGRMGIGYWIVVHGLSNTHYPLSNTSFYKNTPLRIIGADALK